MNAARLSMIAVLVGPVATAMVAANRAVAAPMRATIIIAEGAFTYIQLERETMYTPAVTIVAA